MHTNLTNFSAGQTGNISALKTFDGKLLVGGNSLRSGTASRANSAIFPVQ